MRLVENGVKVNVAALIAVYRVRTVSYCLGGWPSYVSVCAGRIADTG